MGSVLAIQLGVRKAVDCIDTYGDMVVEGCGR